MSAHRIATTYAKSLLDLSIDQGNLEEVKEDINTFKASLESRDLFLLLKSPIINKGKKKQVFDAIFSGKLNKVTSAFFDIVLNKGREMYLPEIADAFLLQYKSHHKITPIKIKTAVAISDAKLESIKAKLLESNITESSLDIVTEVDPTIIGGFVIEVGDKLYDASVAHKLETIKKEFLTNEYVKAF
jgi:F-type H+-transporting ATPase subunit delta